MYITRIEGDRLLISIEESVEDAIAGLHPYIQNSQERFISAAWRSSGEQEVTEPPKVTKQRRQNKRKQDQCIRTNNIKTNIDSTKNDPNCGMCEANDEIITDIISEFPKLLHKEYKRKYE